MSGPWDLDLRPERRPRNFYSPVATHGVSDGTRPANEARECDKREWVKAEPDHAPRRFNPMSGCFELPAPVRAADDRWSFVDASGSVLRRVSGYDRQGAAEELRRWHDWRLGDVKVVEGW